MKLAGRFMSPFTRRVAVSLKIQGLILNISICRRRRADDGSTTRWSGSHGRAGRR